MLANRIGSEPALLIDLVGLIPTLAALPPSARHVVRF